MPSYSKDKRDIYYRKAKELGLRARSAFKLLQIDEKLHILQGISRAVDLCAAPGGWTQILCGTMLSEKKNIVDNKKDVKICAVDIASMAPITGVHFIKGDITRTSTLQEISDYFGEEKTQIVVCDGAPDIIGVEDVDEFIQHELVLSALNLTSHILEVNGTFVAKIFRGNNIQRLYTVFNYLFDSVVCAKPKSSRNSSMESFIVCKGYNPPDSFVPSMQSPLSLSSVLTQCSLLSVEHAERVQTRIVPFVACGHGYDSDRSYTLNFTTESERRGRQEWDDAIMCGYDMKYFHAIANLCRVDTDNSDNNNNKYATIQSTDSSYKYHKVEAPPIDPPHRTYLTTVKPDSANQKKGI